MKYIRTVDGHIYDISDGNFGCDEDENWFVRLNKGKPFICLNPNEKRYIGKIIDNKDTIEELCDCFVAIRPQPKGNDYYILHRFAFVKENCLNGNEMVYGGIWTDKGLTYVAKLNEKGELELL